jgi:hypothetical protein
MAEKGTSDNRVCVCVCSHTDRQTTRGIQVRRSRGIQQKACVCIYIHIHTYTHTHRQHEASRSDDPESASDRNAWKSRVQTAVAQLAKLNSNADGGARYTPTAARSQYGSESMRVQAGGNKLASGSAASVNALQQKLQGEEAENEKLKQALLV